MNSENVIWRNVDYWKYEWSTTIIMAFVVFFMVFFVTIFVGVLAGSTFVLYFGFGIAWFGAILVAILQLHVSRIVPEKVGYDVENIYYIEKRGVTREINFGEIEKLNCSQPDSGYIGIKKDDGTYVQLGPGCGGRYGKNISELYCNWVKEKLGKHAEIKESKKFWPIKIYEIEIS